MEKAAHDNLWKALESDEAAGYLPICADQEIQCQPWADHAVKAQREREHPHHWNFLPHFAMWCRRYHAVYSRRAIKTSACVVQKNRAEAFLKLSVGRSTTLPAQCWHSPPAQTALRPCPFGTYSSNPSQNVFSLGKHILIFFIKNTPKNAKTGSTSSLISQKGCASLLSICEKWGLNFWCSKVGV